MNKLARVLALGAILITTAWLSACSKPPIVIPKPAPQTGISPEQQQCLARCTSSFKRCQTQYQKIYRQCAVNAKHQAHLDYDAYVTAQLNAKKKIQRAPDSFLDLSTCEQQLSCGANYAQCHSDCNL